MSAREGRSNCGGIEGIPNDIKEIGLAIMGFRTLEISTSCGIHIKEGQLEVTSDAGVALIPVEDLGQIMVHGANIRISTMDLSILSQNKVSLMTLDEKYSPTAIVLPFEGHAR